MVKGYAIDKLTVFFFFKCLKIDFLDLLTFLQYGDNYYFAHIIESTSFH